MLNIFILLLSVLFTVMNPAGHKPPGMPAPAVRLATSKARVLKTYSALPMRFEVNQGQADRAVGFLARGQGYTILLQPSEAMLALESPGKGARSSANPQERLNPSVRFLRMRIEGANSSATANAVHRLPGISNYFIGNDPSRWKTNIPNYEKVEFKNIRRGVDLVYYGNQSQLEYDFILSPGARPQSLGLSFEGSDATLDPQGNLIFNATDGQVSFRRPVAYQYSGPDRAKKHYVDASFILKGHNEVGFEVADYDPRVPLVIDPSLYYSTYLGGNGGDSGNAIALDQYGDAFVTGSTTSSNFPTSHAYQKVYGGDTDAFVTMLRYDGQVVIYSTYLGGNNIDVGTGIAIDSSGDAYIGGSTSSSNFPNTPSNVFQVALAGSSNAFVAKLDPSGTKLLYSTFLGGSNIDYGLALAVDPTGDAYITGSTQSTDFPTLNPIQSGNGGNGDAFVTEINPTGTALVYSTYLGGSSADSGQGITVDQGGNTYVTGYTFSTNFPTFNPYQANNAGSVDAFIAQISSASSGAAPTLVFSTYLGGKGDDRGYAIALDSERNIYVTGTTRTACLPETSLTIYCAPSPTFPITPGAFQTYTLKQAPGYSNGWISKFNFPGTALLYSTLLGGSLTDAPAGIAVDGSGNAYVTGNTNSSDFPTANALQGSYTGGTCGASPCPDAFVTEVNSVGTSLVYSTYLGGSGANYGTGIAVDSNSNAYVVGTTTSPSFPAVALAYQGYPNNTTGLGQAFVSMVSHNNLAAVAITPSILNFGSVNENTTAVLNSAGQPAVVTLVNEGTAPLEISSITTYGDFGQTNSCPATLPGGGGACTINVTFTPTVLVPETEQLTIVDNAAGSPHLVTLNGKGINETTSVLFTPSSLVFPEETINTTSPPETITMYNNGQTPLTITNVTTLGDFAVQSTNCPVSSAVTGTPGVSLGVNQSCYFNITFTPTNSGTRTGTLSITDNTPLGTSSVSLEGSSNPTFGLTSSTVTQVLPIGTTTTTFTIGFASFTPHTFTDVISLGCSGAAKCTFSSGEIAQGQPTVPTSTTMTLSGLSTSTVNPFFFNLTGTDVTSGIGTATLSFTIFFSDFSLTASPAVNTVASGGTVIYTISVAPVNAFNQPVVLSCLSNSVPQGGLCIFSPAAVTPSGGAGSSQLTVSTTAQSTTTSSLFPRGHPRLPPGHPPLPILWGICGLIMFVALLARFTSDRRGMGRRRKFLFVHLALATLVLASAFWMSCDTEIYTNVIQPSTVNGTPTGNYKITVLGTYNGTTAGVGVTGGTATTVIRQTTINLTVE